MTTEKDIEQKLKNIEQRLNTLEVAFRMHGEENNRVKELEQKIEDFLQERNPKLYQLWMISRGC